MRYEIEQLNREVARHYPNIEQPLRDGHRLSAFSSGGGLRVVRIENTAAQLIGYGEAPQIEEALVHAALDYQLGHETYSQQYSGKNSRYTHYLTGTTEISSQLDGHLRRGATFDARISRDGDLIEVCLAGIKFPPEIPDGIEERVTSSLTNEIFEERGVIYQVSPYRFPGGQLGISVRVLKNPNNVNTSSYNYTQTGAGRTFDEAVIEAFEAPEVEIMGFDL